MIQVKKLNKAYGPIQALRDISFEVKTGEVVGLLGPNGAGKSTTIKILTGYIHPDAGNVSIDNMDVVRHTRQVQSRIGYLSENTPLYPELSVQSYLKLIAEMRGIHPLEQKTLLSDAIYATGLVDHRNRRISHLSKGLRQRVGLAQAILHKPRLLILDEPTVGLDPTQIIEIRSLIRRLAQHSTILFSSHILSEVEAICDRIIILINGQIHVDAYLDQLAETTNTILVLQNDEHQGNVMTQLESLRDVQSVEASISTQGYPTYHILSDKDIAPAIYRLARQEDWPVRELRPDIRTLESIFNDLATTV